MNKIIIFFTSICFVFPVSAIIVQSDSVAETAPVGLDWSYVYNYKGSSAVAVGGDWLLTAGHVADDGGDGSLTIGTNVYIQQEIVYCPDTDLALIRYDRAFPGFYELYTSEDPTGDLPGLEVLMVGFGTTGTVSTNYYTDSGTGRHTKRWGSQAVDRTLIKRYDSNGTVGYTANSGFVMEFDLGDTSHEAGGGAGDSGGGVFYNDGGVWKLAGIMTSLSGGPQYTGTFAVATPAYTGWIMDTIPEPAAVGMMGFGTIGLFLMRAGRQKKRVGRTLLPLRSEDLLCDHFREAERKDYSKEARVCDYLRRVKEMIASGPLPVWMDGLHTRYHSLNDALWGFFSAAFDRAVIRKEAIVKHSKNIALRRLDLFLERISWDRIVISVHSGRDKAYRALKTGARSLDAFLEIIPWDQMASVYRRCRKAIRRRW